MGVFEDRDIDLTTPQASEFLALVWFYIGNGMVRRAVARNDETAVQDMLSRLGISDTTAINEWMIGMNRHRQAFEEAGAYVAMTYCKRAPCHSRLSVEAMREILDYMRAVMDRYAETGG
jgi:hypothetical protein